ncbi:MAG: PaaI family thioesterase [Acidimicrobiales bacterium]|nr:PaaI family thioesterase [Acidimicrobiales bacterium]
MARELLENARWGFDSNCFVCEPANQSGLGIGFYADRDAGTVSADFSLDHRFSGAPSYVHGGLVLAVLDEAMAWATISLAGSFAVTKETTTRFRAPVRVGESYSVTAGVEEQGERELACWAEITDAEGGVCSIARATFVRMGPAQAVDALGAEVSGDDAAYVRDDGMGQL